MPHVALRGAGFSRNWGGWLAPEALEYLLGCPQIPVDIRDLLWRHRRQGGFEAVLAQVQADSVHRGDATSIERLDRFRISCAVFWSDSPQSSPSTKTCFSNVTISTGTQRSPRTDGPDGRFRECDLSPATRTLQPACGRRGLSQSTTGSSRTSNYTGRVTGLTAAGAVNCWSWVATSRQRFRTYLSPSNTRLMVIGYSFGDEHINRLIMEAASRRSLGIFIIDPLGADVIDKNRDVPIYSPDPLFTVLHPHLIGASRRSIRDIFGADRVEHAKVMRFFL